MSNFCTEISENFEIDFGEIIWNFGLYLVKEFWENNSDKNFRIFSVNFEITKNFSKTFKETTQSWEKFIL